MKQSILSKAGALVLTGCIMVCSLAPTVRAASSHDNRWSDNSLLKPTTGGSDLGGSSSSEQTMITPDPLPTFSDVTSTNSFSWAFDAVGYVSNAEYMAGTGEGKFSPKGVLTRGEIVTIIRKVSKKIFDGDESLTQPYSDVKLSDYYYAPVAWAYSKGLAQIIQTSNKNFGPKESLTRAQIAEVLWTLAKTEQWTKDYLNPIAFCPFTDISGLTANQKKAIKWCYSAGIMGGTGTYTFSPNDKVSRAQIAVMCYKLDVYVTQKRAFCVGTDWRPGRTLNSTGVAEKARDCFQQLGYRVNCVTAPTKTDLQDSHNIRSKVLFFAGHGSAECVQAHYQNKGGNYKTGVCSTTTHQSPRTGYHYVGIEGNMQLVDLAVFAGCETAGETADGSDNIAKRACRYGAKNTIGWSTAIYPPAYYTWLNNFSSALSKGTSVLGACIVADGITEINHRGSSMKNWVLYYHPGKLNFFPQGNSEIADRATVSSTELLPQDVLASYAGSTRIQGSDLTAGIAAILQDINSDFTLTDYTTHVYSHGSGLFTVDFVRTIHGFETDSGYSAFVEGNTVLTLCDNTEAISTSEEAHIKMIHDRLAITDGIMQTGQDAVQPREVLAAMQLAMEQTQASPLKEVDGQSYCYYYDLEQKQAYILVYTDYYYDGTEAKGEDLYEYKLEMEG